MMTASSLQLFPCRVQLVGLPVPATSTSSSAMTNGAGNSTTLQTPPQGPPMEIRQSVSRNLFGSPVPGEVDNIFQQQTKRQHRYIRDRYNIDVNKLRDMAVVESTTPITAAQPTQLPPLIAHEVKQHEQCLQQEKCNLNRTVAYSSDMITPPNAKIHQPSLNGDRMRRPTPTANTSSERRKPYTKQPSITAMYNFRKKRKHSSLSHSLLSASGTSSAASSPAAAIANTETLHLHKSPLEDTHRNVLPQAEQAIMAYNEQDDEVEEEVGHVANRVTTTDDSSDSDENDSTEQKQAVNGEDDCNDTTTSNASQKSRSNSTLSVNFVLTTQTAATITASSPHQHA
ncbi:uncharacterized protein LOC106091496 [Stomoxys calcitrans]|uniref:uncharacterized protein LOC106091496 n=1 Tax=Stomoxys calcitrans TaxID=35570 RepID=UPI0027E21EAB|nr:uncharacterized protein LOC106091496 [Stomoxys calcitrans]